jgi:hypothetical protein|tara:strand:- start:145 stop:594 length:450 start_codon:yes stop_codon:yes gene_type:complete
MKVKEYNQMMSYLTRRKDPKPEVKTDPLLKRYADLTRLYDDNELAVKYNPTTGIYTNPNRDVAFKDAKAANDWNMAIGAADPPKRKKQIKPFNKVKKTVQKTKPVNIDFEGINNGFKVIEEMRKPLEVKRPEFRKKQSFGLPYLLNIDE